MTIVGFQGANDARAGRESGAGGALTNLVLDPAAAGGGYVELLDVSGSTTERLAFATMTNVVPCFLPGIAIATPEGECPVEELRVGDRIVTRDNGIQKIRWIGHRKLDHGRLAADPHLKPILIRKGSLGVDLPERDMLVSPNHRMLAASHRTALYYAEPEVLIAAKNLIGNPGICGVDVMYANYIHFMCDRHEVVLANGTWTESFLPGDMTLGGMGNAQRNEIFEVFPDLKTATGRKKYGAARRILKGVEALLLHGVR
jgi:hypothetical protein